MGRRFHRRYRQSREAGTTRYYARAIKRAVWLLVWIFVLFVVVMALIWVVPKVWHWALG